MRRLAAAIGALLAVPAIPLALLAATTPVSPIGFLYVAGVLVTLAGLITSPLRRTRHRGMTRAGLALLVAAMLARCAVAGGGKTLSMTRGASSTTPSSIACSPRPTSGSPRHAP